MGGRVTGLFLVVAALLFLWLYDTGRWQGVVAAAKGGQVPAGGAGTASTSGLPGLPGTGVTSGTPTNSAIASAICAGMPEACPFTNYIGPAVDAINGTIGQVFGFRL